MQAAVESGDAEELAELMRQDPGFDVNQDQDGDERTLLHQACEEDSRSAVIPLLLAHPDIDVNAKEDRYGWTPFFSACQFGSLSCVREMLKDSRVDLNEPDQYGRTALLAAVIHRHLCTIQWWIASGREMNLGEPGDVDNTDAIGAAKEEGQTEMVTLLERFQSDAAKTRHAVRVELGLLNELAAEMFALVVFVSDGLLQIKETTTPSPAARFIKIARRLPLELQMVLCFLQVGSPKEIIPGTDSEVAFKELARRLW